MKVSHEKLFRKFEKRDLRPGKAVWQESIGRANGDDCEQSEWGSAPMSIAAES